MPALSQTRCAQKKSGNLGNPGGLHHWRSPLALRETGSFVLVGVDPAEFLPVGIEHADEVMVMPAATIFAERTLALDSWFFRLSFCHVGHPVGRRYTQHYLKGASAAQVPDKIVTRTPL